MIDNMLLVAIFIAVVLSVLYTRGAYKSRRVRRGVGNLK